MSKITKLTKLGSVLVGDRFIFRDTAKIVGQVVKPVGFEGQTVTVLGFMPASYVNRVLLNTEDGHQVLFRVEMVERGLRLYPVHTRVQ